MFVGQAIAPLPALAIEASIKPYLDRVLDQVSEFILDNGMKFIVLERHQAPVVSMMLYAKVGAPDRVLPGNHKRCAKFLLNEFPPLLSWLHLLG